MKKTRFIILFSVLIALFTISAFAKTHRTDIVATDTIEYTLEEEDKLLAELFIEKDGLYEARLTSLSTSGNFSPKISIKILDGNKEIYSFSTDKKRNLEGTEPKSYGFMLGLFEGEYKVEIENLTKFSDVSFVIETTFTKEKNIESFANHDFVTATPIETGEKYYGSAVMSDEEDFFSFEMPYDGVAYIQMYSPDAKFFTLYNEKEYEIGSIGIKIDESDKIYELRSGLTKGKYYIAVHPDEDYCLPTYTLRVETTKGDNFEKECNNGKNIAMEIQSGKEYQGNLFGIHDIDVYKFELSEECLVTIDFTDTIVSKDNHYSLKLTDGENTPVFNEECGRVSKQLSLDKGTYYLAVADFDEYTFSSMGYKVKVSSDKGFAEAGIEIPEKEESEKAENETAEQFADVTEDKWYYDEILEAKSLGLINGAGENLFKPEENVSVAEVIVMAVRIKNTVGGTNTEITNSPVGKWYNSYITFAVNSGIIKTSDFDDFERNAARAEVAYIFANVLGDIDLDKKAVISDVDDNTKYSDSIYKLFSAGILRGDGDGKFRPDDSITRAETAAILLRVHKTI